MSEVLVSISEEQAEVPVSVVLVGKFTYARSLLLAETRVTCRPSFQGVRGSLDRQWGTLPRASNNGTTLLFRGRCLD